MPDEKDPTNNIFAYGGNAVDVQSGQKTPQVNPLTGTINSTLLAPTPQINFTIPNPSPVPAISGLDATPPAQLTQPETVASELNSRLRQANEELVGESEFRRQIEAEQGIPELQKRQTELTSRLKSLQNEALAIPQQLQLDATGRGITAGGLRPIETAALRNNAIQALGVSSLLEASRGNLTLAQDLVDRAVKAKYDPIREEIKAKTKNLELIINSPEYTLAEKNRAQRQKEIQDANTRTLAKREQDEKDVRSLSLTAQKYGAPADVIEKIQNAKSFQEAQLLAGIYLQDPMAKQELENAKLDNKLKQAQINKIQKETRLLGEPSEKDRKEIEKALKEAKASLPIMQDKIDAVDVLLESPGMNSRVGTGFLSRGAGSYLGGVGRIASVVGIPSFLSGAVDTATGAGQSFSGGIHQLVSGLTLDNLIAAKERGATFGALSEGELGILAASATKISDWEIKDKNGKGTGFWNVDENSFKKELQNIKTLTNRAILKSRGSIFSDEEQSTLDDIFDSSTFNPLDYFNQ